MTVPILARLHNIIWDSPDQGRDRNRFFLWLEVEMFLAKLWGKRM